MSYRKDDSVFAVIVAIIGIIGMIAFFIFIGPWLTFWIGYLGGWVAEVTVGDSLCRGLNTLFNTTYFTKDMLPLMGGALGWIGHYFKSTINTTKKSKE